MNASVVYRRQVLQRNARQEAIDVGDVVTRLDNRIDGKVELLDKFVHPGHALTLLAILLPDATNYAATNPTIIRATH